MVIVSTHFFISHPPHWLPNLLIGGYDVAKVMGDTFS